MKFNSDFYEVRELKGEYPHNIVMAFQDDEPEAVKFKSWYESKHNIPCEIVKTEL